MRYKWNNSTTNYTSSYDSETGTWSTDFAISTAEAVLINIYRTNNQTYVFSGIIETNLQKSIPFGYSMLTFPPCSS